MGLCWVYTYSSSIHIQQDGRSSASGPSCKSDVATKDGGSTHVLRLCTTARVAITAKALLQDGGDRTLACYVLASHVEVLNQKEMPEIRTRDRVSQVDGVTARKTSVNKSRRMWTGRVLDEAGFRTGAARDEDAANWKRNNCKICLHVLVFTSLKREN